MIQEWPIVMPADVKENIKSDKGCIHSWTIHYASKQRAELFTNVMLFICNKIIS